MKKQTALPPFTYIANGRKFKTADEVSQYAASLGLRVTKTETINHTIFLCYLNK